MINAIIIATILMMMVATTSIEVSMITMMKNIINENIDNDMNG